MSDIAIRVRSLSKRYRIGTVQRPGALLSDRIVASVKRPRRRASAATEDFWALRDVSFEISHGEAVGIIGRNGAGKSTLLKILSRITKPTEGRAELYGRIGSLLEVGTGFHPELTGRDNVFLNGAILGMRRAEILRKFDEIVAFAEVEQFIDTPVKHYSSGMTVRLAFAVAAYLDPEVLLVDEVLAVGDAAFQKKCLGKMTDVAREGRTVMFVSHDLTAVQILCERAIRLAHGQVQGSGPVGEQIAAYLSESKVTGRNDLDHPISLSESLRLVRFGFMPNPIASGSATRFEIEIESTIPTRVDEVAVLVHDALNRRVGVIDFRKPDAPYHLNGRDSLKLTARLSTLPLVEGEYRLGISLRTSEAHDILYDLGTLDVIAARDNAFVPYNASIRGVVAFDYAIQSPQADAS